MRLFTCTVAFTVSVLGAQSANAVREIVQIEKPFHSKTLSGIVLDPSGAPVAGVEINDCDDEFKQVMGTVTSDAKGSFSFRNTHRGTTHYLSFTARGFNPLRITVILEPSAARGFRVALPIGG
jgi:hypothetical protein